MLSPNGTFGVLGFASCLGSRRSVVIPHHSVQRQALPSTQTGCTSKAMGVDFSSCSLFDFRCVVSRVAYLASRPILPFSNPVLRLRVCHCWANFQAVRTFCGCLLQTERLAVALIPRSCLVNEITGELIWAHGTLPITRLSWHLRLFPSDPGLRRDHESLYCEQLSLPLSCRFLCRLRPIPKSNKGARRRERPEIFNRRSAVLNLAYLCF